MRERIFLSHQEKLKDSFKFINPKFVTLKEMLPS